MRNLTNLQKEIYLTEQQSLQEYHNSIKLQENAIKADKVPNNEKNLTILANNITKNSIARANLEQKTQQLNKQLEQRLANLNKNRKELSEIILLSEKTL